MIVAARSPPMKNRDYLSFSSLSLFASCPLRWYFRYLAGLPEDVVSASLVYGGAIHRSLQFHFEQLLAGSSAPSLGTLLEAFWDEWHQHDHQMIQFGKGDDLNSIAKLAERMLTAFQMSDLARPRGTIIAVEEELRGQLAAGLPNLLARVDLIVESDDAVTITDFKTARSGWSQGHVEDAAGQLLLYHELAKTIAGEKVMRLEFAVLTKAKFPEVVLHPVDVDQRRLERMKKVAEHVWRAIENGHFYPSPSPINCPSCPYRAECRAWVG